MRKKSNLKNSLFREHVVFLGNRDDMNRVYQAMDVLVLPSRYEGLPVVGVEAQAAGLPCILSDKMTKETKITDGAVFLGLSQGAKKWAEAVSLGTRHKRADSDKALAHAGFSIAEQAERLEKYYESAAEGTGIWKSR